MARTEAPSKTSTISQTGGTGIAVDEYGKVITTVVVDDEELFRRQKLEEEFHEDPNDPNYDPT